MNGMQDSGEAAGINALAAAVATARQRLASLAWITVVLLCGQDTQMFKLSSPTQCQDADMMQWRKASVLTHLEIWD